MIYSYQKHIDELRTVEIRLPMGVQNERIGTELATIDGITYVHLPDDHTLPEQPPEINPQPVTLTTELRDAIKAASPHVRLINSRIVDMIRLKYSADDEIKMLRLAPSEESAAYNSYVEQCRSWGRDRKAEIGL